MFSKAGKGISKFVKNTDWFLFLSCVAATVYGIILIYSTTASNANAERRDYMIQIIAAIIGVVVALIVSVIDYEFILRLWPVWAAVSLILVGLTFTPLGMTVGDDKAWIGLGPVTLQPSELLKIAFILSFTFHLTKVREKVNEIPTLLLLCLHGLLPVALIFLQGDDGTALVFAFIFLSMMFVAGLRPVYFIIAFTLIAAAVPIFFSQLDEAKKGRFLSLFFVDDYIKTAGWQQWQALLALGSGQLWGLGFTEGGKSGGFFARNNDFIFTVAGEEFGFVGAVALIGVLLLIIVAILRNIFKAKNFKGMLICAGVLAMIASQSMINIGMNLRVLPVIGITLPFFSRGGTSVATLFLSIGLVMSVHFSSKTRVEHTLFSEKEY